MCWYNKLKPERLKIYQGVFVKPDNKSDNTEEYVKSKWVSMSSLGG